MTSKPLALLTTLILSSCGSAFHLSKVDTCGITPANLLCNHIRSKPIYVNHLRQSTYTQTPLQATGDICYSTGDYLVEEVYIIHLENNLANCIKDPVIPPKVSDCVIAGADSVTNSMVYCSDGVSSNSLTWAQAVGFPCLSSADYVTLKSDVSNLIQDIANCTPPSK